MHAFILLQYSHCSKCAIEVNLDQYTISYFHFIFISFSHHIDGGIGLNFKLMLRGSMMHAVWDGVGCKNRGGYSIFKS